MATVLKAEDVSIRYITGDFKDIGIKEYVTRRLTGNYHVKEFMAVDGVSFTLEEGDMLGIIGANGAGKSTLLKAVAGIMEPTRGKIIANGEVAALLELGSGFDGDLTVRENAYLRGAMLGYTKEFMDDTYDQIIDFAELREFEDRPFKQLSSGMKSRLAFSIASLVKPDILILDEVLSVGDGAFQEKSASKMREIISQGATTILVSHSLEQIRSLCNKVLWLDHGKQVAFGDTKEICDQYERFLQGEALPKEEEEYTIKNAPMQPRRHAIVDETKNAMSYQIKRYLMGIGILTYVALMCLSAIVACMSMRILSSAVGDTVGIVAELEAGKEVIFRGAIIDGDWYNPDTLYQSGDWEKDVTRHVLKARSDDLLQLHIPTAKQAYLVFNVGPNQGKAEVTVGNESVVWDFYQEADVETGISFLLPQSDAQLIMVKVISFIVGILVFVLLIYAAVVFQKRTNRINWKLVEKVYLVALLPVSFLFLLFLSLSSTPRISEEACFWGYDAAIFNFIGKAWGSGITPYLGTFENKGPLIFWIYMMGDKISPQWGVFAIQIFALYISLVFSYKIGRILTDVPKGILASLATLAFFAGVMDESALTEDFNVPLLMISAYLIIRYLQGVKDKVGHPYKMAFVHGLTIGVSLLLRITNCIALCGFLACIGAYLLIKKKYRNFWRNIGAGIAGFCVIVLPFVVFFAAKGALYDFAYGTILFNLDYAGEAVSHSLDEWKTIFTYLIPVLLCIFLALEQNPLTRNTILMGAAPSIIMMARSYLYPHYYIVLLPFVPIGVGWLLQKQDIKLGESNRYTISYAAAVTIVCIVLFGRCGRTAIAKYGWINSLHTSNAPSQYAEAIKAQSDLIPISDRDRVVGYNVRADWYLISKIYPCFRHGIDHDYRNSISEKVRVETVDFFESLTAEWIVVQGNIEAPEVSKVISEAYHSVDSKYIQAGDYQITLYKKNDN